MFLGLNGGGGQRLTYIARVTNLVESTGANLSLFVKCTGSVQSLEDLTENENTKM